MENEIRTLTKQQIVETEKLGRDLALKLQPHWTGVAQVFLDTQLELGRKYPPEIAVCSTMFALENHVSAIICSLAQGNAPFVAQRVLERVKAHTPVTVEHDE